MPRDILNEPVHSRTLCLIARDKNSPIKIEKNRTKRKPYYNSFKYLEEKGLIRLIKDEKGRGKHIKEYDIIEENIIKFMDEELLKKINPKKYGISIKFDSNFEIYYLKLLLQDFLVNQKDIDTGLKNLFGYFFLYVINIGNRHKLKMKFKYPRLNRTLKNISPKDVNTNYEIGFMARALIYTQTKSKIIFSD